MKPLPSGKDTPPPKRGSPITEILVVDDHPLVRQAIRKYMAHHASFQICGEAACGEEALSLIRDTHPDLVLLDLNLGNEDGLALVKKLRSQFPRLHILILSIHNAKLYAERALRNGANGYIMKSDAAEHLTQAIAQVMQGEIYATDDVKQMIIRDMRGKHPATGDRRPSDVLTDRELQVFRLIGEGNSTRRIATELDLSIKTVETHRANIRRKLHVRSARQLADMAVEWIAGVDSP